MALSYILVLLVGYFTPLAPIFFRQKRFPIKNKLVILWLILWWSLFLTQGLGIIFGYTSPLKISRFFPHTFGTHPKQPLPIRISIWIPFIKGFGDCRNGCAISGRVVSFLEKTGWLALSREWRNEALHGHNGDSFPHSLLRASQLIELLPTVYEIIPKESWVT